MSRLIRYAFCFVFLDTFSAHGAEPPQLTAPEGYEVQLLDPLGGKVLRPKSWHFRRQKQGSTFAYQIYKENVGETEQFDTGLTINLVMKVKEISGVPPTEYAEFFFRRKLANAKEVLREKPRSQGKFVRKGLMIDEVAQRGDAKKEFRIAYTMFCSDETDVLIIMIFGCPKKDWAANEDIQRTMMDHIVLVDRADAKIAPAR